MDFPTPVVLIVVALFAVGWVAISPDPLARALKARFVSTKLAAANAVDDAVARIDKALNDLNGNLAKITSSQLQIKTLRHGRQAELTQLLANITKYDNMAKQAAARGRRDLVVAALQRKTAAEQRAQT